MSAFLEVGGPDARGADHGAIEHRETLTGRRQFILVRLLALRHENAEKAVFAAIGVDFATKVLCDFASGDGHVDGGLVGQVHYSVRPVDWDQRVKFARHAPAHPVGPGTAMQRPGLIGQIDYYSGTLCHLGILT